MPPKDRSESHIGSQSSEERRGVRQGELGWVPGLEKNANFRLWYFQFRNGAETYLNTDVYPDPRSRRFGFLNALTRAAQLGKNDALLIQLELYDNAGLYCDALVDKIKQKYLPKDNIMKTKMCEEFFAFKREGRLGESVEKLNNLMLECQKAGYEPDESSVQMKYKTLLRKDEITTFELYISRDQLSGTRPDGESVVDQTRRVMELLALDREGVSKQLQEATGFSGGAFGTSSGDGKKRGKRRGKGPRRQGYSGGADNGKQQITNKSQCKKCGRHNCKSLETGKATDCYYHTQTCNACGATGHKASCCPKAASKQQYDKSKPKARVHFAGAEDADCDEEFNDVPPGFQGCQPKA
jgi:hypothetical protein